VSLPRMIPGSDLLLEVVSEVTITKQLNTAATLILVYDYLLTFGDEVQRVGRDTAWSGAKVLWLGHRYLNLVSLVVIPIIITDTGALCNLENWFPILGAMFSQFFVSGILYVRCWALFRDSCVILGSLIAVYLCCLGFQIGLTVVTFNVSLNNVPGLPDIGDQYLRCFAGGYLARASTKINFWRIGVWVACIVFDSLVVVLTAYRAIRLRMLGMKGSIVQTMLREGIYYFTGVFALHILTVLTFALHICRNQFLLQRMSQVLTVVMISHMFLDLKSICARETESCTTAGISQLQQEKPRRLDLIGTFESELERPSVFGHQH